MGMLPATPLSPDPDRAAADLVAGGRMPLADASERVDNGNDDADDDVGGDEESDGPDDSSDLFLAAAEDASMTAAINAAACSSPKEASRSPAIFVPPPEP